MNASKRAWADRTWNPITGCKMECTGCDKASAASRFAGNIRLNLTNKECYEETNSLYVLNTAIENEAGKQVAYPFGFNPTLHMCRMDFPDKLKSGMNILVGSMGDMFGSWVPDEWIETVFQACHKYSQHRYLFLTKDVMNYNRNLPESENYWYGTEVNNRDQLDKALNDICRENSFIALQGMSRMDSLTADEKKLFEKLKWVIIQTDHGFKKSGPAISMNLIKEIVTTCDSFGIPVFMEPAVEKIVGKNNMRTDKPKQLTGFRMSEKRKERYMTDCMFCHKYANKSEMFSLTVKKGRSGKNNTIAYICEDCMKGFCRNNKIRFPESEDK